MRSLLLVTTFLLSSYSFAKQVPYRPASFVINPKSYQIDQSFSMFSTLATFDQDGLEEELVEGTSFSMIDSNSALRYGFGDQLELRAGIRYRQLSSEHVSGSDTVSFSNSGLESYMLGGKYAFKSRSKWRFALDASYRMTTYTNEEFSKTQTPTEEIVLGDSGKEVEIGLHTSYQRNKNHFFSTYFAYKMPSNNMSQEVPYMLESAWGYTNWGFRLGLKGVYSLEMDDFKDVPADKPRQSTGPTRMFNSINRSWMTPYVGINYAFNTIRMELSAGQRISGVSTDKGLEGMVNFVWNSRGVTKEDLKVESFKEYEIEATVIKISPRKKFVKIDMGVSQDVDKGMKMDIFQTDFFGGNVLVAQGVVYEVGADWAIIKILKRYRKIEIKNGFLARGY